MTAAPTEVEWSIQEIAKAAGTTSRALRHYGQLGLLEPSRVGRNGYRYYDQESLVRLQRILLLRELGLGLPSIGEVLDGERDSQQALRTHLDWLEQEQDRLGRQIESVRKTLRKLKGGERLMAEETFDGFDHTQYKDEVIEKWGKDAYEGSANWWTSLSEQEKRDFQQTQVDIATDFAAAHQSGEEPGGTVAQGITQRHYAWLSGGWSDTAPSACYFTGLGEMYVADPRFTANYDQYATGTAEFVRDAMTIYAERNLK